MNAATFFVRLSIGATLASAAGCSPPVDKSIGEPIRLSSNSTTTQAAIFPVNTVRITLPAPPPPQWPEPGLSGQDAGYAESELPTLLGYLWYPDAKLSLCSHTQRGRGAWPTVTLLMPSSEKPRDIINYYETRFPGGERKGNEEYLFQTKRPGDERPVRVHLLRATSGSEATQFVARIGG